jgi:CheY-like chemotaxis protein
LNSVLIVEDEPLVRMATVDLAIEAGFSVVEASSADEALIILQNNPAIEMVITDVDMPGSINGIELARLLRQEYPRLKIAVVSGVFHQPVLPAGIPFFTKPLRDDVLLELLNRLDQTR